MQSKYFFTNRFLFLPIILFLGSVYAESNYTNLREPKQIEAYQEVTEKIRCICLPSLPIKSCSYSNCQPSALVKDFIEYRIKNNESAEFIINHLIHGYGESFSADPYIAKLVREGNEGVAQRIIYGFGEKMLAKPDPFFINLTLFVSIIVGFMVIGIYIRNRNKKAEASVVSGSEVTTGSKIQPDKMDLEKYLKEI